MRTRLLLAVLCATYAVAAACGARSELRLPNPGNPVQNEGGGAPECVVFNSSTELAPLDVFIMLDRSGSMGVLTTQGIAKWYAIRDAFEAFFYDPQSRGINVAFGFFPVLDELAAETCDNDTTCGTAGACKTLSACPSSSTFCESEADCDFGGFSEACTPLGRCSMQQATFCFPGVMDCGAGQGVCETAAFCENRFTCASAAYEEPYVELGLLPDHAFDVLGAFNEIGPDGGTPTLPALTGVVEHAVAYAIDNPNSKVITVLATDGVATACDPAMNAADPTFALANLVGAAEAGADEGVQTFVIGVFAPEEQAAAEPTLNAIAEAGGTAMPFIVDSSGEVTGEFQEALNQVRVSAKACEFDLDQGDEPIDYAGVWVKITQGSEETWVPRVDSLDACDPFSGGFFYDQPVPGPIPPTSVRLCPATCELLGASADRRVEIYTSCGPGETG